MSRLLILPDLHQNLCAGDAMVRRGLDEGADRFIFLGDLFDQGADTPESGVQAARWLLKLRERLGDRLVVLLGNHDLPYAESAMFLAKHGEFPSTYLPCHRCSGYDAEKATALHAAVGPRFWDFWQLHHREDGVLFTHAGADAAQETELDTAAPLALEALRNSESARSGLFAVGESRGGPRGTMPGILWRDLSEFADEAAVFQIFGHTQQECLVRVTPRALCLDAGAHAFALLDDGSDLRILSTFGQELTVKQLPFDPRYAAACRRHGRSIVRKDNGRSCVIARGCDLRFRLATPVEPVDDLLKPYQIRN